MKQRATDARHSRSIFGLFTLLVLILTGSSAFAQLAGGTYTVGTGQTYTTLAAAVTAANSAGISGAVVFDVAAGHTETVAAGGIQLGSAALNATLSSTNTLTIQKSGSGANPLLTAYTGGTGTPGSAVQDGVFRLYGADYVTIDGIDVTDNAANTTNPSTMEYGYAMYKLSATDGCQHNTIKNCTVTLNRINNASSTAPMVEGSVGIAVMNATPTAATTVITVTAASGSNSYNAFYSNTIQNCNYGIAIIGYAAASPFTLADQSNDIGGSGASTGNTIKNFGGATGATNPAAGVRTLAQYGLNVSYNTVNNNDGGGVNHVSTLRGIYLNTATSASATISYNTLTLNSTVVGSQVSVIENVSGATAASNTISINNNTIQNCTNTTTTTGLWYGIYSTASCATLNINNNTFSNNATKATSGNTFCIYNTGAVTTNISITGNSFSHTWDGTAAYTGTHYSISNTGGTTAVTATISANSFANYNHTSVTGSGSLYFINNTASCANLTLSDNQWVGLTLNHSGSEYLLNNASSTQVSLNVNNNNISGGYTRNAASGLMYCYYAGSSSLGTSTQTFSGNSFTNIQSTTAGTGAFYGLYSSDGASSPYPKKAIYNNTISDVNYNTTGTAYGLYFSYLGDGSTSAGSELYGNSIQNVATGGTLYGISTTATASPTYPMKVYGNTVSGISTSGTTAVVYGAYIGASAAGTLFYRNNITNVSAGGTTGTSYGFYALSANPYTVNNNFISGIKAPIGSNGTTASVNGMWFNTGSTVNVYYNTVYLAATSSGANFSTTALYASTTPTLLLINNIFVNASTPTGSGLSVAYRRSSTTLTTYASTSNTNCFYAGSPSSSRLLYYDGTNSDQLISAYKTRVSPRDASSFSENPPFVSNTAPYDLHLSTAVATRCESNGSRVTSPIAVTDDFDGQLRWGETGYSGASVTGTDIGADEGDFTPYICSGTPYPGVASIVPRTVCSGDTTGIYVDGVATDPGITYQWEESDDNGVTDPWANAVGGSGSTGLWYTTPAFTTAKWYRLNVTCTPSATSAYTNAVQFSGSLNGTTYTINSGAPSSSTNFQSFTELATRVNNFGLCGSSVVTVTASSGPYTEHFGLGAFPRTSLVDTLGIHGNGEILQFTPTSSDFTVVDLNGADGVSINELTIKGLSPTYGIGVALRNGANKTAIHNCTIDLSAVTSATAANSAGIAFTTSLTTNASAGENGDSCRIHGNTIKGGAAGGPFYGIVMNGASGLTLDQTQIMNNTIKDFYQYGIWVAYLNASTIVANDISRPALSVVGSYYGVYLSTGSAAVTVEKNRIHNTFDGNPSSGNSSYGIYFNAPASAAGTEITVKNNLLYAFNGIGTQYGMYSTGSKNVRILHNTISLDDVYSSATTIAYGIYLTATVAAAPGIEIYNNCLTMRRTGSGNKYGLYFAGSDSVLSNYNNVTVSGGSGTNYFASRNAVNFSDLAAWQGTWGFLYDQNSVSTDPVYENPSAGNFKPQASALDNAATNLSSTGCSCVVDDITGASRSTTPDMGAYEFAASSMAVTSVVTTQTVTSGVAPNSTDQQIIGIEVTTMGVLSPLAATSFTLSTNGSTAPADIANAKLYYAGTPSSPSSTQFGSTFTSPSGSFTITGSQTLSPGVNYFVLKYDIATGATNCNSIDAECSSVTIGSAQTPSPVAPAGVRYVKTPLSGSYAVNSGGSASCTSYLSIAAAIADVNALGVSGPVIFNVAAGHTETSAGMLLTNTTPSATNPVTFVKSGSGANPKITAAAGTGSEDGVVAIAGTDYVTFDGIDIQESSSNLTATTQMEYAFAIVKGSASDGSQHITITNSVLSLNKSNPGTAVIYQNNHTTSNTSALTVTNFAGTSSYNTFTNNTISNTVYGIYVYGSSDTTFYDHNVEISGNTVSNFGGSAASTYGMYTAYQDFLRVANNTVGGVTGHTGPLYGIYLSTATNASYEVTGNTVTLASASSTGAMYGMYIAMGASGTANIATIANNSVTGCSYPGATSATMYSLYHSGGEYTLNMYGNNVTNNTYGGGSGATATGTWYPFYTSGSNTTAGSVHDIYGNTLRGNTRTQSTLSTGTTYTFYVSSSGETLKLHDNVIGNNSFVSTSTYYGFYLTAAPVHKNVYQNRIDTLVTGGGTVYTLYSSTGTNVNIYRNSLSGVTATGNSAVLYGMYISSGTTVNLFNNFIFDLTTPTGSSASSIYGAYISAPTTARGYFNTIHLNASSSSTTFGTTALYASTTPTVDLRNNILNNSSTPGSSSGNVVAYQRSSTTLTTYADSSNSNCLYAGSPGSRNLLFYDGTNSIQTLANYKTLMGATRETAAITENTPFVNVATKPYNLHVSTSTATKVESAGRRVTTVEANVDIDGTLRQGETGYAGTGVLPDIGADEGDFIALDDVGPTIAYTSLGNGMVGASRSFSGVSITDFSGVNTTSGTRPRVYYKKGVLRNEWNDNTSSTEGWKWVEANGTATPFDFTLDYTKLPGGSVAGGDTIWYFVVAQDLYSTPNVGINSGTFAATPAGVTLTGAAFPIGGTPNAFKIVSSTLSGTYAVGTGQTYQNFTSTGGFFDAVNNSIVTGNLIVQVVSDIAETGSIGLREWSESGTGNYTLTIQSDGNARAITGAYADSTMIKIDGADRVTIDGGSSRLLTFRNTGAVVTTAGPVFHNRFNSTNCTLTNLVVECNASTTTRGAITLSGLGANTNNTVSNCIIRDTTAGWTATLANGIFNNAAANTNMTISNNEISNFSGSGVTLNSSSNTVTGNSFFMNLPQVNTRPSLAQTGIRINGGDGNVITGNFIGGSSASCGGVVWENGGAIAWRGIAIAGGTGAATSVQNNTIQNVALTNTGSGTFAGIEVTAGAADIGNTTGNTIGHASTSNSIVCALAGTVLVINSTTTGAVTIANNTIGNIAATGTSTSVGLRGVSHTGTGTPTIDGNTIAQLSCNAATVSATTSAVAGIYTSSSNTSQVIQRNVIHDLTSNGAGTGALTTVQGIIVNTSTSAGVMRRNKIYNLFNTSTGVASIFGIHNYYGTWTMSNNMVSLTNGANSNDILIYGIFDDDGTTYTNKYYYNTVYVGGSIASGASKSFALYRSVATIHQHSNNIYYNERSGGTGNHFAIGNAVTGSWTSDYNLLISTNASALGEWVTTAYDFAGWKTNSAGDTYSLSTTSASTPSVNLFTSASAGDLGITGSNVESWTVNGKGIAGTASGSTADDYGAMSVRSTTLGMGTDIGADEFTPSVAPPLATASGAPANSTTTTYSFAGQTLASITWGAGGTVPSALDFQYYSGTNPPTPLVGNYANAYATLTATGGSGFTYDITFGYSPAMLGTISSESNVRLAKRDAGVWDFLAGSSVNTGTKTATVSGLTSFSDFTFTDVTSPLPVELTSFTAAWKGSEVNLAWKTASELNSLRFAIERRASLRDAWTEIGDVTARGSVDVPTLYNFTDAKLPQASELFYRLRKIDRDGSFSYSNIVRVSSGAVDGFTVFGNYPNPFNPGTTISFAIPSEQHVTVRVFDITGRLIETVMDETLAAGSHAATFFAKDLPSGMYRFVITAGTQMKSGTMILTR